MPAATQNQDRAKALSTALAQIDKAFGKGSVMRLGDDSRPPVAVIPTGSVALDVALGIGGLPRGRVVEVYGPESSGKTTVALHAVANCQRMGGNAAFIDAEHALDPEYAKALGVDTDNLLVSQPDTGEQALEIADMLIRSGGIDIIVIDSVAALVPRRLYLADLASGAMLAAVVDRAKTAAVKDELAGGAGGLSTARMLTALQAEARQNEAVTAATTAGGWARILEPGSEPVQSVRRLPRQECQ